MTEEETTRDLLLIAAELKKISAQMTKRDDPVLAALDKLGRGQERMISMMRGMLDHMNGER